MSSLPFAQINAERHRKAAQRYLKLLRLAAKGHTVEEIAEIEDTTVTAAESALKEARRRHRASNG
jgi:hypothetical protein